MIHPHDPWQESAFSPAPRKTRLIVATLAGILFFSSIRAADDDEDKPRPLPKEVADIARKYAGITQWRGFFDSSTTEIQTRSGPKFSHSRRVEARTHGHFTIPRSNWGWDPQRGIFRWADKNDIQCGEASGTWVDQFSEREDIDGTSTEWVQERGGTEPMFAVTFQINLLERTGGMHMGGGPGLKLRKTGRMVYVRSSDDGKRHLATQTIDEVGSASLDRPHIRTGHPVDRDYAVREWDTVRNGPGVLTFSYERIEAMRNYVPGHTHRSRIILFPVYDDLELEVTIDGYAKWRPEGSIPKPRDPGNSLVARATLKSKTGKVKELPEVTRFRFELLDTSREPGVCLNWPLNAKDDDYDLRLTSEIGGKLSDADQTLVITEAQKNEKAQPFAEAKIDSYDFGGRATLQVICELEDGRELMGLIKGEKGEENLVRLPKMDGPDWVAENWRKEKQVEKLPALDDEEKVEGQKHKGDGFTLYEEYRGWVERGKHIEGDPLKKDFFILNLIDADARGGIALFARLSQLRVHSRLRDGKEMAQDERVMNGNHRDAPHRVKQHGVVISHEASGPGGYTVGVEGADKSKAARPASVKFVYVETHHENGLFAAKSSAEYNLSERDAQSVYDRGVAHELLHAVGVDHHGEQVWELVKCYFQGASAPLNPTHRARFTTGYSPFASQIDTRQEWAGSRGDTITLLWEDNQRDIAEDSVAAYEAELAKARAGAATESYVKELAATAAKMAALGVKHDASFWSEYHADNLAAYDQFRTIRVGQVGGTDCGNELCVMRYYFANAYKVAGRENAYYVIRPTAGANHAGRDICRSPAGTGPNAASHQPQSRFGDAHSGRGNCFGDICPNDAIPPRSVVLK
jgi:hypothetical protein